MLKGKSAKMFRKMQGGKGMGIAASLALKANKAMATRQMNQMKVPKTSKLRKVAGLGAAAVGGAVVGYGISKAVDYFKGKKASSGGSRRRKSKIPKTVKRWATRMVGRRKQEEKMVKELFGNDGGKVIKKPKKSADVITRAEALRALNN